MTWGCEEDLDVMLLQFTPAEINGPARTNSGLCWNTSYERASPSVCSSVSLHVRAEDHAVSQNRSADPCLHSETLNKM